jgi:hypothetical protein
MNTAQDFINKPDDSFVTPDSLAWDLIMSRDNEMRNFGAEMSSFVSGNDDNAVNDLSEVRLQELGDEFQILITIYMEMVFTILKSDHMANLLNSDGELREGIDLENELKVYKPDFRQYTIDNMTDLFKNKFKKIRYSLSVRNITDFCDPHNENDYGLDSKYYCKILLLDDGRLSTRKYFQKSNHIPEDKRYTFLGRPTDNPEQEKLDDFFAVVYLPAYESDSNNLPRKIRISFSKYKVM